MTIQEYDFLTESSFVFDNNKIEFNSGAVQLKRLVPEDASFYAPFTIDENETWNGISGTLVGGATIENGKANLKGGSIKYINFDIPGSYTASLGSFQIAVTPNYSNAPAGDRIFGSACKSHGDSTNMIELSHKADGNVHLAVHDENDIAFIDVDLDVWLPVAGQEYIFEFSWDFIIGATRVFIDGTQIGATQTATGVRGTDVTILRAGSNYDASVECDVECRYFILFTQPQNVTDYTITIDDLIYSFDMYATDNPFFYPVEPINAESLTSFVATVIEPNADLIRFALQVNGTLRYWDGAAWSNSSGYAQSNSVTEINTHCESLELSDAGAEIVPVIYVHADVGNSTPTIESLAVEYEYQNPADTSVTPCIVSGYLIDASNIGIENATVAVRPSRDFKVNNVDYVVAREWIEVTTNSAGYFEFELIPSEQAEGDNVMYEFQFTIGLNIKYYRNLIIPDQTAIDFNNL